MSDKKPLFGVLAGEPEIIGERCADGGKCHHRCTDTCSRRSTCAPLSGSGLRFDWSPAEPSLSGLRDAAGDRFEVPVSGWSGPAHDEREAFEAWAKTQGDTWLIVGGLQWSAGTDDYASARTNAAWAAWQERAALSARPAQTAPQPEQSALVLPRAQLERIDRRLTDWLELNCCECESGHLCGRNEVTADRDAIRAALSAVTAERDRHLANAYALCAETVAKGEQIEQLRAEVDALRKDAERWRYVSLQGDDMHWLNLLRVDLDDFGGNINAAVDALIDGEAPAMAAKDPDPEHRMDAKVKAAALILAEIEHLDRAAARGGAGDE